MTPFRFGDPGRALFGIYEAPASGADRGAAVLLCGSICHEYMRAHRALRLLATDLARAGFHVLRFDYFGCGDSSGPTGAGGVAQWCLDTSSAARELREMSGIGRLSAVGHRLGAALAAESCARGCPFDHLVLCDPVVRGREFLRELRIQQQAEVDSLAKRKLPYGALRATDGFEFLGFPFAPALQQEIEQVDLTALSRWEAQQVHLMVSEESDSCSALREALQARLGSVDCRRVADKETLARIGPGETPLLAERVRRAIVEALAGESP